MFVLEAVANLASQLYAGVRLLPSQSSVRSFPRGGHFPGEKSGVSTGTRGSRCKSLPDGGGLSVAGPHGAEVTPASVLPILDPRLSRQSFLPFLGCCSPTMPLWRSLISLELRTGNGEVLRREFWKNQECFLNPWLV